jgi:phage terminase large subunit-like protein
MRMSGRVRSSMPSTMSPRSASRPEPFSVEHFARYCHGLRLDNGERFVLEGFQEQVAADVFAGFSEVWKIVPEGNGKTTFMSALALYHGDYTESAFVPIGASSREQAEILYRQAEGFVFRTPGLRERFKCQEGYRRIKCLRTGGRIQVYAADDRTADGIIPTLALLDELHRHRNLRLYRTWRGKLLKRAGQIVTISTAGEPGGEFEDTRAIIRRTALEVTVEGCHTRAVGDDIVLHDWAVPKTSQATDMDMVAAANPLASLTAEVLRRKRDSPTMTPEHWLRFVCNLATSLDGNGVLPEDWDALAEPGLEVDPESEGFGIIDLGWKIDTTGIGVLLWCSDERRVVTDTLVLEPPVDEAQIVEAILDREDRWPRLRGWVMDPNAGAQQMAQLLEKGEHPLQVERESGPIEFVAHSQDNAPMSQGAARIDEAIRNRWLVHDGDRKLRSHVLNAVRKATGPEKYRFDRPRDAQGEKRKRYPIDLFTALIMGHNVAVDELGSGASVYEDRGLLVLTVD